MAEDLIDKIKALPPDLKTEVETFVDLIIARKLNIMTPPTIKKRTSGQLKGKVWMSPDFDEPLEDLKDYM